MTVLAVDGTNIAMRYCSAILGERRRDPSDEDRAHGPLRGRESDPRLRQGGRLRRVVIAVDSGRSFRHEIYPAYKANREAGSTGPWSERLKAWQADWPVLAVDGFEADDILATFAEQVAGRHGSVCVLSSDSDLLQIIGRPGIECWQPVLGGFVHRYPLYVVEKYEIKLANQFVLYKALVGESGDGIPGVYRIGPKGARKILSTIPTDDEVREYLLGLPDGANRHAEFDLAMQLVVLREDVPLEDPIPTAMVR